MTTQPIRKLISWLVGILIFSVIPVLGWGIRDVSGFLANPYRLAFIIMMAAFSLLVVIFIPNEGSSAGEGKSKMALHMISLRWLQIIPLAMVAGAPYLDRISMMTMNDNPGIRFSGLLLTLIGFGVMNWSIYYLGRQFSTYVTIQEDHELVTSGPYRYIRHPRYLGIIIFLTGISLVFRSWIALIFTALSIALLVWRILDEEKLMRNEFGDDWEKYCQRSHRLIPFIY